MTDRPILFSGPMVRAILDGRKTMTRRVIRPQPPEGFDLLGIYAPGLTAVFEHPDHEDEKRRLPYQIRDRLWVRETWGAAGGGEPVCYRETATEDGWEVGPDAKWRPSIFMPRWASRLTLTVTGVRVERVQDISEDHAIAEGIQFVHPSRDGLHPMWRNYGCPEIPDRSARYSFRTLWDSLNAKRGFGWDANPWIVALTFEVHRCNIDRMEMENAEA